MASTDAAKPIIVNQNAWKRSPDSVARLRGAAVTFLLPGRFGRVLLV